MPLDYGKSKGSFSANVAAEVRAGKPQKQAVAIAFAVKRRGKPKKKKRTPSTPEHIKRVLGLGGHGYAQTIAASEE